MIKSVEDFRAIFRQKMDERRQFAQMFHTSNQRAELWKYRNYDRSFGFIEQLDTTLRRGKKEANTMRQKQLASAKETEKARKKAEAAAKSAKKKSGAPSQPKVRQP